MKFFIKSRQKPIYVGHLKKNKKKPHRKKIEWCSYIMVMNADETMNVHHKTNKEDTWKQDQENTVGLNKRRI